MSKENQNPTYVKGIRNREGEDCEQEEFLHKIFSVGKDKEIQNDIHILPSIESPFLSIANSEYLKTR